MSSPKQPTKPRGQASNKSVPVFKFQDDERRNYDSQMRELRQGVPISKPNPSSPTNIAQIGDVGYMKNGEFYRLFNVLQKWAKGNTSKYTLDSTSTLEDTVIVSPGVKYKMVPGAGSKEYTIDSTGNSGAALFPVSNLQVECMGQEGKKDMIKRMNEELGSWPCPESLARKDLLLVHSRLVVQKWVMMVFNAASLTVGTKFSITIDTTSGAPRVSSPGPNYVKFENGDDITARVLDSSENASPTALPSHCVFLGAFVPKVARLVSWDVEDTVMDIKTLAVKPSL